MDVLRNKRVINDKWTKSEGQIMHFYIQTKIAKRTWFFDGKSCIIWIDSIKCYTYGYVLQHFMGFCGHGIVLKMA